MSDRSRFLLVGNASYLNRGCEAIVRGTVKILRGAFEDCRFVNANFDVSDTPFVPPETDPDIVHRPLPSIRRRTLKWAGVQAADRLCPLLGRRLRFGSLQPNIAESTAALSIGGDNYTLDYGVPWVYLNLGRYVVAQGKPLVIWGASLGPFDRRPDFAAAIREHLKHEVTAVFVREERTRLYLGEQGISENVRLMPDPAFVMDPEPVDGSELGFEVPEGAIGLNLSPLMASHVTAGNGETWERMGVEITRELLRTHGRPILLISHVISPHNDDDLLLNRIKSQVTDSRVMMAPRTLSAAKTKYVISKLSCLVAARTHATIASFSTGVPTVSLAYSRKAYGINEMMFGHTAYAIPPAEVTPSRVAETVGQALDNARSIRDCLSRTMATVTRDAMAAGRELRNILARRQPSRGRGVAERPTAGAANGSVSARRL